MHISKYELPEKGRSKTSRRRRKQAIAELRDKKRRRERLNKRHDERVKQREVQEALAASRAFDPESVKKCIYQYLRHKQHHVRRVNMVTEVLLERAPRIFAEENACVLARTISQGWIRPLNDWVPQGRGRRSQLRSLVEHLILRYPVPKFLRHAFFDPQAIDTQACLIAPLYGHLARGGSIRHCAEVGIIGLPLTRRMCHLFLQSPPVTPLSLAVMRAMVLDYGGDQDLAQAINSSRFWTRSGPVAFWVSVIHWLCRQPDLDLVQVGPLIDYVDHCYTEDESFQMKGRSYRALMRSMHAWHHDLNLERRLHGVKFKPSGFSSSSWVIKTRINPACEGREIWTMDEILCSRELVREGRKMGHCVSSYVGDSSSGKCSIWSLKCDGARRVTVEIHNGQHEVVQARGKYNRLSKGREKGMIQKWAKANSLKVGDLTGGW